MHHFLAPAPATYKPCHLLPTSKFCAYLSVSVCPPHTTDRLHCIHAASVPPTIAVNAYIMGTDDEEAEHQRIMMMQMAQIEEQNRLVDEANAKAKGLSGAIISSMNSDDDEAMKAIQEAQEAARLEAAEEEAKKEAEDHAVMETLLKAADEAEEAKLAAEKKMEEEGLAAEREREKAARKLEAERLAKEQKEMDEAAEKARLAALKKLRLAEEKEKDRLEALAEEQRQKDEASETSRLEAEEAERLAAEQKQAEEEKAKQEAAERIRKQEETAKKIAEERKRNEAELMRIKEEARKKSAEEEQAKIKELEAEKAAEQQRQKEAAEEKAKLEAQEAERLAEEQLQNEVEEANARIEVEKAAAKLIEEERLATEKRQKAEADAAAKAQAEKMTAMKVAEEEAAARLVSEEATKAEEEKILLEEETKRAEEALELEAQMAGIADVDSDAEDLPHATINNELSAADGEDDEVAKLAEEMRKEMEIMGQDNDDNKEEEMEIDFGATVDEIVTPPASLTHSNGKVSELKLSINEKTKEKPFVFPKAGKVTSKASSPSVRSKEVRVTPSFFPKSKAAKSSDMKKPSTRPTNDPGKLRVNTMASSAPLPRVATMSTPPRGNKHRSTLSKPRPESSHSKSSTPLPRVATLPSPARGQSLATPDRLPPKSPASLFGIMPRSQTKTPSNTLPRMLSPRDGPRCPTRYNPELHGSKGACERCLELSSDDEKEKFQITGHHIRIMIVSGGCDRSCLLFPRDDTQPPVRLCKKCYFDTHRTMYDAMEIVPAPVER